MTTSRIHSRSRRSCYRLLGSTFVLMLAMSLPVEGRILLESLCTVEGQHEQRIVGLGLVVGLNKTGDSAGFVPKIRALGSALRLLNNPVDNPLMIKDSNNVAIVMIEATIPATGIRRGQRIDCFVSSIGDAKSLRGGRLLVSPLQRDLITDTSLMGLAAGHVLIEDTAVLTNGRITNGVIIEQDIDDFTSIAIRDNRFNLLLDKDHATFRTAFAVAEVINRDAFYELDSDPQATQGTRGKVLARAVNAGVIQVEIPEQYQSDPIEFISIVLNVGIDYPHTEARVVLNPRNGTIVVTGEVEVSPIIIAHKNLSINVGNPGLGDTGGEGFVPLMEKSRNAPHSLTELIEALNQLRVPAADKIDIIKELKRTGKLHAVVITE
ncbi:MAG: flagellar basal body P-ring protein FlgI [Planctomycetaceae bacterium]|nr:flagellar basal body P-ring protein FlgI [Planctomycetaceae bacterium]